MLWHNYHYAHGRVCMGTARNCIGTDQPPHPPTPHPHLTPHPPTLGGIEKLVVTCPARDSNPGSLGLNSDSLTTQLRT